MRGAVIRIVVLVALAVVMTVMAAASASATNISIGDLQRAQANDKACTAALKSGKVVTAKTQKQCENGLKVTVWYDCPDGSRVGLIPQGKRTYYVHVGTKPALVAHHTYEGAQAACA
jgi:hypothetical protein